MLTLGVERLDTRLDGLILVKPIVHEDERGFVLETYRRTGLAEIGINDDFVQENHSRSHYGVVRGMHYQLDGMAKLVRCPRGSIVDVVVDLRRGSPTFGQWEACELTGENLHQLYCPAGFGHGFAVTSDFADVLYKCSEYYNPELERGFKYDDPDVAIVWPDIPLSVSVRDAATPRLAEIAEELPFVYRT
jgi:dTDP-4-dehydrorhamnose 3,5-epimerase